MLRSYGAALLLLPLAACMQGPISIADHAPLSPHATLTGAAAATATQPASSDKMTIGEAFQLALARNERVWLAQRAADEADIHWNERWTEVAPNLSATVSGFLQREHVAGTTVIRPAEQVVGGVVLAQPLFRRGFFDSRAAGQHGYESATAAWKRVREELARDVAEVFIDVLKFRQLRDLAHTSVARAKTQHDFAGARVKAGQALRNAELLAQIDVKRAERQELTAARDADAAEVTFQRLVGRAPPAELEVPAMPSLPDQKQALAAANGRTDLKALRLHVDAAKADQEAVAGHRWWPRLDVTAIGQYLYPKFFNSNIEWQVIGVLTIPLLQSGKELTDLALAENAAHVAELELEQQRKIVVEEVDLAALQIATATQAADLAKQELDAAKEHYTLVDKQVRLGAITFLEVTNAQAVLVEAENAFEVATMDRIRAAYDYLFAIGALDLGR